MSIHSFYALAPNLEAQAIQVVYVPFRYNSTVDGVDFSTFIGPQVYAVMVWRIVFLCYYFKFSRPYKPRFGAVQFPSFTIENSGEELAVTTTFKLAPLF